MLDLVIEGTRKDLGGGLEIGRVLPFARRRMVGPFIFLDHMGPADFRPGRHRCPAASAYWPCHGHLSI
jgi:redox-sensitive bicupin YhaK (pirin superfamily)